jgi:hypothetical protein
MPFPASDPFDITFSEPVIGLNITGVSYGLANGLVVPSNATMTVYDINGNILATVPAYYVTPWNQPASNAQWSFGYPATGQPVVARVHFDPAGEHLPVLMNFTASIPGPAQMSCTPASVVRGGLVRCEVTDGSNVQVTGWSFTTNETPAHVIDFQTSSLIWEGVIAVGGTASVTLTDGGNAKTLTAPVDVTARNWSQLTVNHTAMEVFTPLLPNPPAAEGDLGDHLPLAGTSILSDGYAQIQSGPNTGVFYVITRVPVDAFSQIRINRLALSVGSAFYNLQPASHPRRGYCKRSDVLPFIPVAGAHEGLQVEVNSHAWAFRNELNRLVPAVEEAVIGYDYFDLVQKAEAALQSPLTSARQASSNIDITNPIVYCTFKY